MVPKMPAPTGSPGFLFVPPYRVQGYSTAGEQTVIQIPELDTCFDMGSCPRFALSSPYVALSHAHMDHIGGLPYYFSQRMFQKMGVGTCVCHPELVAPIRALMETWVPLERQHTQYELKGLEPDEEIEIKPNIVLRALQVSHTVPALGYALIEKRSKLKDEFRELPQERLRELRNEGVEITKVLEIPLVAYTGDTEFGPWLFRDEFAKAAVVIAECTFVDAGDRGRAAAGKHMHASDILSLLEAWESPQVILCHLSRRCHITEIRETMRRAVPDAHVERLHLLMDLRANRERYERQLAEAQPSNRMRRPARRED